MNALVNFLLAFQKENVRPMKQRNDNDPLGGLTRVNMNSSFSHLDPPAAPPQSLAFSCSILKGHLTQGSAVTLLVVLLSRRCVTEFVHLVTFGSWALAALLFEMSALLHVAGWWDIPTTVLFLVRASLCPRGGV